MKNITLPLKYKIVLFTFSVTFVMVGLQKIGVDLPNIISPLQSSQKQDVFNTITPLLEEKKNDYVLHQSSSFISKAQASTDVNEVNAYVVIDYDTGSILADKNSQEQTPIASLTKIMTSVVALDLADPQELFTVSKHAASQIPTKIGVVPGQKLSLHELLQALMLTSANDAADVVKEGIDTKYGEEVFIKAMNKKAEILGLTNSHFTNPQGFDSKENYSSAEDLAVLTAYAMKNYPLFSEIVKKDYVFLAENKNHKQYDLYNWNGLLGVYPNVSGVKIGNTDAALKTTIVLSEREGKNVLVVLLGAPGILERDLWTASLLDFGFTELANLEPIGVTDEQLLAKYATWKY